ncbi:MAG TPA: SMP-30/gluconolactonase/LRE family protein [Acetobacteraceae bacterium]|nr:SMP-30/gluconolactonase/LRE family protein [Acetobacteraceae bacterium]
MLGGDFEVFDERGRGLFLLNAAVERIATGLRWAEGPVWFADGRFLLWSDIPNNRIMRWVESAPGQPGEVSVFRQPANNTNGHTRDRQGRLVSCEHGARRVTRTEHDGRITVLADAWQGRRLNSPNDVVVKSDGSVWFTDPDYGIMTDYEGNRGQSEIGGCHVYRIDPDSAAVERMTDDYERPNGIAFSPDESLLYVVDTGATHRPDGPHHIRVHEVIDGRRLGPGRVFAVVSPGLADGLRLDENGNVWTSAGDGVHVYAPDGTRIGRVKVPEVVANLVFGGACRNRLFICATTSVYSVYVAPRGAQVP